MSTPSWLDSLRKRCGEDPVLFYVARWCQKRSGHPQPDVDLLDQEELDEAIARIRRNLREDGPRVERFVAGDPAAVNDLRRELVSSARSRVGPPAAEFADEALGKIAEVLLIGTRPSRAGDELRRGPTGPGNEYVFESPFSHWARMVVINLIRDERRRAGRAASPPRTPKRQGRPLDRDLLDRAAEALPGLLDAIRALPPVQRSVLALSLAREDVDELAREQLRVLAPDLLDEAGSGPLTSDREIADRLRSTPRNVAASRSAARRKLARRDPLWALLLDALLPHRSTRPVSAESNV
jgi:hypothetical protein